MFWTPTRLNHTSSPVAETPVSAAGSHLDLQQLEIAFRQWIVGRARPELLLLDPDGGAAVSVSMEDALRRLRASQHPLRPAPADRLGLSDEATIGAAAEALLQARLDPDGPRCRSFRSAALYLVGLAELQLDGHETSSLRSCVDAG